MLGLLMPSQPEAGGAPPYKQISSNMKTIFADEILVCVMAILCFV